jgi:membrane associated rhomboid family serine protease
MATDVESRSDPRIDHALATLHDPDAATRPIVTYAFLAACVLVTVSTLLRPELYGVFGGIEPRAHGWQPFTAALEHGWPGFHGAIHLALNAVLILECGRPCERVLGNGRFFALSLLSLAANAWVVARSDGVNGSSLVIWSWGPVLFVALAWARRRSVEIVATVSYQRIRGVLVLMYVVITVVMGLLPRLSGWGGGLLHGLVLGNLYHLVATAVGIGFAAASVGHIRRRLAGFGRSPESGHGAG